jgi:hypothetical protein
LTCGVRSNANVSFEGLLAREREAGTFAIGVSDWGGKDSDLESLSALHPWCSQMRLKAAGKLECGARTISNES